MIYVNANTDLIQSLSRFKTIGLNIGFVTKSVLKNIMHMKTILLIEDNKDMRENIVEILNLANYDVLATNNGKDGVRLAKEKKPDLIVCDIMMPELDGYEVLYLLSQNASTADIPFIFLTAKTEKKDVRKGMSMGADDYITKPFEGMDLLAAIEMRLKKSEIFRKEIQRNAEGLNEFFSAAKGVEELEKFSANRKPRLVKKKSVIYMEGDEAGNVVFIVNGMIKTSKMNMDGKIFITGIHSDGEFIGSLDLIENKNYKETAVAIEDSKVILIPKLDFHALLYSNRDIATRFIHLLSNDKEEMEELLLKVAFNSVRKRVADSLIRIMKKYPDEKPNSVLPITRSDLASLTGIAPETLSRTLGDFRKEKYIDFQDKHILILNPDKLLNMKD